MALASCAQRTNPFLAEWNTPYGIPPFDQIQFADYIPAVKAGIEAQQAEIDAIVASQEAPTFESVIAPFDRSGGLLAKVTGVLYNVSETENCPEMEAIIEEATPLLSAHEDGIYMNKDLYRKVAAVYEADQSGLTREQQVVLKKIYEAFQRNGVGLTYQKEYDSFRRFLRELFSSKKKRREMQEEQTGQAGRKRIRIEADAAPADTTSVPDPVPGPIPTENE